MVDSRLRWRGSPRKRGRSSTSSAVVESGEHLGERQPAGARRGELDGQRQSVEAPAQFDRQVDLVVADWHPDVLTAFDEQLDRRARARVVARGGERQRSEREDRFSGQVERRAAGSDDGQLTAGTEHLLDRTGSGVEQTLAVVDHEQHRPIGRGGEERIERVEAELGSDAPRTASESSTRLRSTRRMPASTSFSIASASSWASADLPTPPGPTMVTSRRSRTRTWRSSSSRHVRPVRLAHQEP